MYKTLLKRLSGSWATRKSTQQLVKEIHETFYTEADRLLAEAKVANSLETDKQEILEKGSRLLALGFTCTKEVRESTAEAVRLDKLMKENKAKEELIEAINYFGFKYPQYKFITEGSVKKICEKYGLVYGEVSRYMSTVPDKNLKHIEDFKIQEEDKCCIYRRWWFSTYSGWSLLEEKFVAKGTLTEHRTTGLSRDRESVNECPMEIAAPLKDFDTKGMEIKDMKISNIEIPDPVVLQPVVFKDKKHYLIVTAWGEEASDELVVNQRSN
jgi:hypothetical protein